MINIFLAISIIVSFHLDNSIRKNESITECTIKQIFEGQTPKYRNTKVLTPFGELQDVDVILVPTKQELGRYSVKLSRKGSNLYKVASADIWIETMYCYEFAIMDDAVLIITSNYGYTQGKVIFE